MILLSHPTANANVRQAALAFHEAHWLREFWTCVAWNPKHPVNRLLPRRVVTELARRSFAPQLEPYLHTHPRRELVRLICGRVGLGQLSVGEDSPLSIDAVYRSLDGYVARRLRREGGVSTVYAFEDGALETFRVANELGARCLYELPIGYWRAARSVYQEEAVREPAWAPTLTGCRDSPTKLARKDTELQRADQVIVASRFTERTLQLAPHSVPVVTVIPYGAPAAVSGALPHHRAGKLRVLFVGALGQRKGLSYLVTAVERMSAAVELTLLGVKTSATCAPLNEAVRRHPWIPSLPHAEVLAEMGRHDLLVFPSLFEGFGLVILEALSQGIPVITTPHTGGPDVITEGVDGFIVPIRSSLAIAEKLELLARDHPLLCDMKEAARATARRLSWENYRSRLVAAVTPLVTREIGLVPQPLTEAR